MELQDVLAILLIILFLGFVGVLIWKLVEMNKKKDDTTSPTPPLKDPSTTPPSTTPPSTTPPSTKPAENASKYICVNRPETSGANSCNWNNSADGECTADKNVCPQEDAFKDCNKWGRWVLGDGPYKCSVKQDAGICHKDLDCLPPGKCRGFANTNRTGDSQGWCYYPTGSSSGSSSGTATGTEMVDGGAGLFFSSIGGLIF